MSKMKSMTLKLTEQEYKKLKIRLINENRTFQDYATELIRKEIEMEDKKNGKTDRL